MSDIKNHEGKVGSQSDSKEISNDNSSNEDESSNSKPLKEKKILKNPTRPDKSNHENLEEIAQEDTKTQEEFEKPSKKS